MKTPSALTTHSFTRLCPQPTQRALLCPNQCVQCTAPAWCSASVSLSHFLLGGENSVTEEMWKRQFLVGSVVCQLRLGYQATRSRFPDPRGRFRRKESSGGGLEMAALSLGGRTGRWRCHTLPCSSELASAGTGLLPCRGILQSGIF